MSPPGRIRFEWIQFYAEGPVTVTLCRSPSFLQGHQRFRPNRGGRTQTAVPAVDVIDQATIFGEPQFALGSGNKVDPMVAGVVGIVEGSGFDFPFPDMPPEVDGVIGVFDDEYGGSRRPRFPQGDFRLGLFQDLPLRGGVATAAAAGKNDREEN